MAADPPGEDLFDGIARLYDADYRNQVDDIQMVVDFAQQAGEKVLDLGCGTGRVMLPVAGVGCAVTGVDGSPALLGVARRKMAQVPYARRLHAVQADLRSFALEERSFDFAYCVGNTLMHLTSQAEQLAALGVAGQHLRPDGLLLLDLFNPDLPHLAAIAGQSELADRWWDAESGAQVLKWSVRWIDPAPQIQRTLFIYEEILPSGQTTRTVCPFSLRYLWASEGQLLLQMAGFAVEEIWGDYDGTPHASDSERLIFLARRLGGE